MNDLESFWAVLGMILCGGWQVCNDKFIFLFLKFLQQYFHCQNEIDFKVWIETVKVKDSYGKKWLKVQLQLNLFEKTHYHLGFR